MAAQNDQICADVFGRGVNFYFRLAQQQMLALLVNAQPIGEARQLLFGLLMNFILNAGKIHGYVTAVGKTQWLAAFFKFSVLLALEPHAHLAVFKTFPAMHPIILKGRQAFSDFRLAALNKALNAAIDAQSIAEIHAVDISETRMKQVKDNLWRLRLKAHRTVADAAEWTPEQPVDAVLLDAPCSGTGTIRRHPDIARLKTSDDIQRLTAIQDRLLAHCADILRPGGLLVYATCSLQPEEGPVRIEKLLADGAPFERDPVTAAELPGLEPAITANGEVRTLPSHWAERGGLDGFFIARLRRV